MNNNNTVGVVHKFEETPILLSQLLGDRPTKRGILLKEKLIYDPPRAGIKSKSAFYVLKLPSCTKALKLGRGLAGSDGILSRLGEYKTKYGNAKIMYLRTFTYTNASPENQPVSKFEKKIIDKLKANNIDTLRGNEYFPNDMLDNIKTSINSTEPNIGDDQPVVVRRNPRRGS